MSSAGLLTVRARLVDGQWQDLAVSLQRPPVTRLFEHQVPEAVVKAVPYLFTLCAHAQRAAAQAALAAAAGEERRPVDAGELWIEMLHENFWRLLLDWPPALGLPDARDAFVAWRAARSGDDRQARTEETLKVMRGQAADCLARLGEVRPSPEPVLAPEAWLGYWQGTADQPPPTTQPVSVAAAYRRRLREAEVAAAALAAGAPYPIAAAGGEGWGVGQTLTARGVLTHAAHVDAADGKIVHYKVWAPTDALFADTAALAALLAGQRHASPAAAKQALNLAVLALDPCLPYTLELQNA